MFPIETTTIQQRTWPAFLLMGVGVVIFLIPGNQHTQVPVYIGIGVVALSMVVYVVISRSRIVIDDVGISKTTVFKTLQVSWSSVSKTYLRYQHHGKSRSLYWVFEDRYGKKSKFHVHLLSRKSLRMIAEAVTTKCKTADVEKRIYNIAEGEFPWYIW
jgi:hypothetical protein